MHIHTQVRFRKVPVQRFGDRRVLVQILGEVPEDSGTEVR